MPRVLPGSVSELPLAEDGIEQPLARLGPRLDAADRLGQPPVDDQGLAVLAQDDIRRLDVAVDHAAGVGIVDGVADVEESAEQLAELQVDRRAGGRPPGDAASRVELVDRFLEAVAADEPHGVIRAAVAVSAQSVDGDDPGVLEAAGDLGLDQEAESTDGVVGVVVEDLLECDLAVELGIERDEDGAQAAPGMRPQDAEPLSVGGGRAHGIAAGALGVVAVAGRGLRRADVPEGRLDLGAAGAREALASRASDGQDGEALAGVAAERLDVQVGDGLDGGAARGIEVAEVDEVVGQGSVLVASPGGEGREQRPLVDQAVLEGQQAEEQVARRGRPVGTW